MASSPISALLQIAGCRAGYRSGASVHTQQHRIDGARRRRSAVEWHGTSLRLTGNNSQTNHAHARKQQLQQLDSAVDDLNENTSVPSFSRFLDSIVSVEVSHQVLLGRLAIPYHGIRLPSP
jgi:hypothetical protein